MRPGHVILLALLLAGALWLLLRPNDDGGRLPIEPRERLEEGVEPWMRLKSATLLLRVRGADGSIPLDAEAGYKTDRGARLRAVHPPAGEAEFTDAPLGEVVVLARAPGFQPLSRLARLEAGTREELLLVLEPEEAPPAR